MIPSPLIEAIRRQYRLPWDGIHGVYHWARVLENGLRLAERTGANVEVVKLFAVFHDACRINESHDPGHGGRGSALAESLRGRLFELPEHDFVALKVACRLHTEGQTEGDTTVQTCWDADRLDLGRVGIAPSPRYLCTQAAKDPCILEWANDRSGSQYKPDIASEWSARFSTTPDE